MKKLILFVLLSYFLNALDLNFEDRQDLIFKIKQTILNEELIAESMENYIIENYKLPTLITELGLDIPDVDTNYFLSYLISTLNQNLIIGYNLKSELDDLNLIKLYKSDTFRDRTFYYNDSGIDTIRILLNNDLARHIYGLIKFNGGDIVDCEISVKNICLVTMTNSIRVKNSLGNALYEYKIENYKSGPMMITDDTTLHTSSEFDFVPNGVNLMDTNGLQYIKTNDGIVPLQ